MNRTTLAPSAISAAVFTMILAVGLFLLLYPGVSNYWNSLHQTRAVADYIEEVDSMQDDMYAEMLLSARAYNESLVRKSNRFFPSDEETTEYMNLLKLTGTSVMGYIEIEKIDCYLPIYHGTSEAALQLGAGHLEGSSLPIGGESTHAVISGHRGLASAKLFTDLDRLELGDTFVIYVLNEVLTYEIDQILIVEPTETEALKIVEGEDYCTLVTCTPLGINSHRILVRGHRIDNVTGPSNAQVEEDAAQIDLIITVPLLSAPILLTLLIGMLVRTRKRRN